MQNMSRNNSYHIGDANIASCKIWPLPILLANFGGQFWREDLRALVFWFTGFIEAPNLSASELDSDIIILSIVIFHYVCYVFRNTIKL